MLPELSAVLAGESQGCILCADCRDVLPTLPDGGIVVVSDPPYGIAYKKGVGGRGCHSKGHRNIEAVRGDDEPFDPSPLARWPCVLFGADHYCNRLPDGGMFHVWDKECNRAGRDSFSDAELFWTSWTQKREVFRYLWKGLRQEGRGEKRHHPTAKPVRLMMWCIDLVRSESAVILDPFCGSGTTCVAAKQLGRRYIGIEIDEKYAAIARERVRNTTPPLFGM